MADDPHAAVRDRLRNLEKTLFAGLPHSLRSLAITETDEMVSIFNLLSKNSRTLIFMQTLDILFWLIYNDGRNLKVFFIEK